MKNQMIAILSGCFVAVFFYLCKIGVFRSYTKEVWEDLFPVALGVMIGVFVWIMLDAAKH